jgi:hypothetical protein
MCLDPEGQGCQIVSPLDLVKETQAMAMRRKQCKESNAKKARLPKQKSEQGGLLHVPDEYYKRSGFKNWLYMMQCTIKSSG